MNKTDALNRLTALESEAAKLRKILEAPEPAPSLLTKPTPLSGESYWYLSEGPGCALSVRSVMATGAAEHPGGNVLQSKELAVAYAEAVSTLLLLRHQPGTVPPRQVDTQFVIEPYSDGISTEAVATLSYKLARVSPCFDTREQAQAAIAAVGAERILRMLKTLHHIS